MSGTLEWLAADADVDRSLTPGNLRSAGFDSIRGADTIPHDGEEDLPQECVIALE